MDELRARFERHERDVWAMIEALINSIRNRGDTMKIDSITRVKQTADENVVNEYLAKGYKIIKIFSGKVPFNEQGDTLIQPIYVLGIEHETKTQAGQ